MTIMCVVAVFLFCSLQFSFCTRFKKKQDMLRCEKGGKTKSERENEQAKQS